MMINLRLITNDKKLCDIYLSIFNIYSEQCQTSPPCLGQSVPRQPQRRSAAQPGGGGGGGRPRGRDCRRY